MCCRLIKIHCIILIILLIIFNNSYAIDKLNLVEDNLDEILENTDFQQSRLITFNWQSFKNQPLVIKLEKIEVFTPESEIILHTTQGRSTIKPLPTKYFEGYIENKEGSHIFLDFTDENDIKGIISLENKNYFYQNKSTNSKIRHTSTQEINNDAKNDFQCLTEKSHSSKNKVDSLLPLLSKSLGVQEEANDTNTYITNIILETDYEYYSLFNDTNKAIKYSSDLIAYTSSIYKKELNSLLKIKKLNIYLTNSNPWQATDTNSLLDSLEHHYKINQLTTKKDAAIHLLSGKRIGGLAYIGSLCNNLSNFGVSGGLYGTFNISEPRIVWDAKVFAHELGHNFGAVHTHTYYPQPIDCCFFESTASTCANYEPYTQLPGINSLTGGEPEKGTGTIMSYCHKVTGKLNNISLTLGRNHSYGIEPDRVPDDMRSHLLLAKKNYPQCLPIYFPGFAKNVLWSNNKILKNNALLVGDFNGDTKSDLMDFSIQNKATIFVSISDSSAFKSRRIWLTDFTLNGATPLVGDFNGDGKDDLIKLPLISNKLAILAISTGSAFKITKQWTFLKPESQGNYFTGDFNGDKKSDLGFLASNSNNFYVAISTREGFNSFKIWAKNLATDIRTINIGDFNGDQKDDIALATTNIPNRLYVSLSNGSKLKILSTWTTTFASNSTNFKTNDFNADGFDDILYTKDNSKNLYVMLSNKSIFDAAQNAGTVDSLVQDRFYTGNFNTDNAADILTISNESPAALGVMTSLIR